MKKTETIPLHTPSGEAPLEVCAVYHLQRFLLDRLGHSTGTPRKLDRPGTRVPCGGMADYLLPAQGSGTNVFLELKRLMGQQAARTRAIIRRSTNCAVLHAHAQSPRHLDFTYFMDDHNYAVPPVVSDVRAAGHAEWRDFRDKVAERTCKAVQAGRRAVSQKNPHFMVAAHECSYPRVTGYVFSPIEPHDPLSRVPDFLRECGGKFANAAKEHGPGRRVAVFLTNAPFMYQNGLLCLLENGTSAAILNGVDNVCCVACETDCVTPGLYWPPECCHDGPSVTVPAKQRVPYRLARTRYFAYHWDTDLRELVPDGNQQRPR